MTTLNVRWEPAEGLVKEYKVIYVPAAGGAESMVGLVGQPCAALNKTPKSFNCVCPTVNVCEGCTIRKTAGFPPPPTALILQTSPCL